MEQDHGSFRRKIYLLGVFRAFREGQLCALSGEKTQGLLAYLALHPRMPHPREKLADLFYPEAPFERVRRNLSDTLYRLQKALGNNWFVIERDTIALRLDQHLWVDVWEFERLAGSDQEDDMQKAVELYAGDLLPEFYDDWLLAERELHRNQYLTTLENLAAAQEASGKLQQALLSWRRLISAEPLHEPAHQAYLRLLGRMQRYGEALGHFQYLQTLMQSELGVEPLAETRLITQAIERERDLATVQTFVEERTPFIGRTSERAAALMVVEAMLKGQGAILAIEGEAGIGKSRLLREIASGIRWRGATLLQGNANETPGASPFTPLIDALAPLINSPRGAQLETMLKDETLATLAMLHPAWKEKAGLEEVPPEVAANRFYDALHIFGETIARLTPLVLALDDLQWADLALWKSLDALAQGLVNGGGLLMAIYRRPDIEDTPGWEIVQTWDRASILKSISLQPLSIEEISQLVQDAHQIDPTELYAWTGGNPFYIHEWLATPEANKSTSKNPATSRLQSLSPNARLALESAAVLGESIPYHFWTEISNLSALTLASLSDELVVNHWLQPSAAGYAFEHDLLRNAVYQEIEPARRRSLHGRVAKAYVTLEPDNLRARAFHYDQAGDVEAAARAYKLAGEQDLTRFAFQEAQNALDRALTLMPATLVIERFEIAITLAEVCDTTGDRVRQKSALDAAISTAGDDDTLLLRALLAAARFNIRTGNAIQARQQIEAALALARGLRQSAQEIEALLMLGNLAIEQGQWNEVHDWALQALERARSTGNQRAEGRALRYEGIVALSRGNPAESIQRFEEAIALQHAQGDRFQVSITQTNLLFAFSELGAWDRLINKAQELVLIKDALGDRLGATITRHNLALAYYGIGQYALARQILEKVVHDSEAVKSRRRAGLARNVLGLVAEGEGNYDEALQLYRTALDDAQAVKATTEVAYAQHDLGALLLRLGQPSEAIPLLKGACTTWIKQSYLLQQAKSEAYLGLALRSKGDGASAEELAEKGWATFQNGLPAGETAQDWLWALYLLLKNLERPHRSEAVLRAAHGELQRQAHAITNPDYRHSFFAHVPVNRAIVDAYDQLAGNQRAILVSLARRDVPLGRSLREDELIPVQWTLSAPEDDAITGKSERRQYRLKRLLNEAEQQGAAPTDDDLAQALGVSRRTILRDMKELAQKVSLPSTRKRKT